MLKCATDPRVLDFVGDLANGGVGLSALIRQRGTSDLGGHLSDGDRGGVVESRLRETDLQSGIRRPSISHVPTAQQKTQQSTSGRHL